MIKFDKPYLDIKGTKTELMVDLCCIIEGLHDDSILSKEDIDLVVTAATAPEELLEKDLPADAKLVALALVTFRRMKRHKKGEES